MRTKLFYYTGTGNSLWSAQQMARELGEGEIVSMMKTKDDEFYLDADAIGLVFPVHMWGIPRAVLAFIDKLKGKSNQYYFAIAVNAGQVSRTLVQLKDVMHKKGLLLSGGINIIMPSNYIPWGGPGPEAQQEKRYQSALEKIAQFAPFIKLRQPFVIERGKIWQRIIFTLLYQLSFSQVPKMDKSFWVDEKCNACGICQKVCPAKNIELIEGKPQWQHQCHQCLACIQWCPQQSIQYGKKTQTFARYHQKQIKLAQIIAGTPE